MSAVEFTPAAVRQFSKLPKAVRSFVKEGIRAHLVDADPGETTRNKFRLRRVSPYADYELRLGDWRVFYRLLPERVVITLLGEKRGNTLIVEGEELVL